MRYTEGTKVLPRHKHTNARVGLFVCSNYSWVGRRNVCIPSAMSGSGNSFGAVKPIVISFLAVVRNHKTEISLAKFRLNST